MSHWLDDYPALRVMQKTITAEDYNKIRIGLSHEKLPWQIDLTQLRCLHCILDDIAWVCIDECQEDLPILAWTNFNVAERESLDAPVRCQLKLYHTHASLVMGYALDALVAAVDEHYKNTERTHYPISRLTKDD